MFLKNEIYRYLILEMSSTTMRTIFQKQYLTEYFILISNRNMKEFFKKNPFAKWLLYII